MLDLARVVALLFALAGSVRARFALGALAGIALVAGLGVEVTLPLIDHSAVTGSPGSALAFAFLGPSALPVARSNVALFDLIACHHRALDVSAGLLAGAVALAGFRKSRPLRPECDAARAWDRAGLRFLSVSVIQGMLVVLDVLMTRLMNDSS